MKLWTLAALPLLWLATAGSARAEALPDAHVAAALFTPTRLDDGLDWRAAWVLTPESAAEVSAGGSRTIRFAVPLTEAETIDPLFGVDPYREGGQVVGVRVDASGIDGRLVATVVHQRLAHAGGPSVRLGAPVAAGHAVQIIDGDLKTGVRLEVSTGRALERHVGYVVSPGVSHPAREEARRLTGYDARVSGAAIYVRGDDVKTAGGLTATLETPGERSRRGAVGIAIVFALVVALLLAAVRKLRHAASVERADAILAAELDSLGTSAGGPR